jgi:hypothetical protein
MSATLLVLSCISAPLLSFAIFYYYAACPRVFFLIMIMAVLLLLLILFLFIQDRVDNKDIKEEEIPLRQK